jgi:hypothetical protein
MSEGLDRRSFLGAVVTAGAVAAAAAVPLTARALALTEGRDVLSSRGLSLPAQGTSEAPAEADWHIDDMWGHTPRYAHPIPYSPMRTSPVSWEHVDPIDRMLVI